MSIFAPSKQIKNDSNMDLLHIIAVAVLVVIGVVIYINKRNNQ